MALVRGDGGLEEGCVETVEGSKVLQSEGTVLFIFPRGPGPPDHLVSSRDAAVSRDANPILGVDGFFRLKLHSCAAVRAAPRAGLLIIASQTSSVKISPRL